MFPNKYNLYVKLVLLYSFGFVSQDKAYTHIRSGTRV